MKKFALIAVCALACASSFAQGTINFNNLTGVSQPVFESDGATKLAGAAYTAELYAGLLGANTDAQMTAVATSPFKSGGFFLGGSQAVPGYAFGSTAVSFQVRVWRTSDGASYAAAAGTPGAHVGESTIFNLGAGSALGGGGAPPATPGNLLGFTSFNLSVVPVVPEPATLALGALGVAALLIRRKK